MSSHREQRQALVVTAPPEMCGQSFSLEESELRIGRAEGNHVRLENPYVSRHHAVLRRAGEALVIEDAGSSSGLWINGVRTSEPALLRAGDHIRLGRVELELVARALAARDTASEPTFMRAGTRAATSPPQAEMKTPAPARRSEPEGQVDPPAPAPAVRFDVPSQRGDAIHNVAGNQYHSSIAGNQYNVEALRIAPMRKRARRVMQAGFSLVLLGFVLYVVGGAVYGQGILHCVSNENASQSSCFHTGAFAVAGLGAFVIAFGVIVVIISLFMRREVRRQEARL